MISDTTGVVSQPFISSTAVADTILAEDSLSVKTVQEPVKAEQPPELIYPVVKNNAFRIGEKLTFKIRYGFIRAGTAVMAVKGESTYENHHVYHIQTTAESAAGFTWIYKVDDVINSYVDKRGLFSWKYDKKIREGSYKADLYVEYFPEDSLADVSFTRFKRRNRVSKKRYQVKTAPFAFDILAAFYYVRTQKLEIGKSVRLINHDNKKVYELDVMIYRRDTLDTDAGKFRCLVVEPRLKGEGIFKQKGRLLVWLTDDQYKIPVQMTSEVVVGHITTELEKIEGIRSEIPALLARNE
jgi:hypothetical protein